MVVAAFAKRAIFIDSPDVLPIREMPFLSYQVVNCLSGS